MSLDILQNKIRKLKSPVALELDLRASLLPPFLLEESVEAYGKTPKALAAAYERAGVMLLDRLAELLPAVKMNTAYYEALGPDGMIVFQHLCEYAKNKKYFVIAETMRSDDGEAAKACAQTFFGTTDICGEAAKVFDVDALCIGAFLGSDGIKPYLPYCKDQHKNLFILAKTPNKSSREVLNLISGDRMIYSVMTDLAMRWSTDLFTKSGYSEIGVVIGATHPSTLKALRERYPQLFFLVTGYGMNGGMAKDAQYAFNQYGHGALVCAGQPILAAWQKGKTDGSDFTDFAYEAAAKIKKDISRYVTVI